MFSQLHLQLYVVNARVGHSYAPSVTKINPPAHPRRLHFPSISPAPAPSVTPLAFPPWPPDSGRTRATEGSCSGNHPYVPRSTRSSPSSVAVTSTPSSRRAWAWAFGPPGYFVLLLSQSTLEPLLGAGGMGDKDWRCDDGGRIPPGLGARLSRADSLVRYRPLVVDDPVPRHRQRSKVVEQRPIWLGQVSEAHAHPPPFPRCDMLAKPSIHAQSPTRRKYNKI